MNKKIFKEIWMETKYPLAVMRILLEHRMIMKYSKIGLRDISKVHQKRLREIFIKLPLKDKVYVLNVIKKRAEERHER